MVTRLKEWENQSNIRKLTLCAYKEILLSLQNPEKVLDWGCGDGLMAMSLFPDAEITGIELDQQLVVEASRNAEFNGKKFIIGTIEEIISKNSHYDVVIMMGVFEYLTDEELSIILARAYNCLKSGGTLFTTFYSWRPYSAIYLPYLLRAKMSKYRAYEDYSTAAGFKPSMRKIENISNVLHNNGFKILELGGVNPYPSWFWKYINSERNFITKNKFLSKWYCTQYILARK